LTSERCELAHKIIEYVREEIDRSGSLPTRYKICKEFKISWRKLHRLVFGSSDAKGKDERDFYQATGIQLLSPSSINAAIRGMQKRLRHQILLRDGNKCVV